VPHCDPEVLALLALGADEPSDADAAHLAACEHCRGELGALVDVVATGRGSTVRSGLVQPPARVWAGIAAELELDAGPQPVGDPGRSRRRLTATTVRLAAAAAIVGILVGATATWLVTRSQPPSVVASADLRPLQAPAANGTAVVSGASDTRTITVRVRGLTDSSGTFYEVWLLDRTAHRLVSLGVLGPGETGTFAIPASLDLRQYPVVDVSLQVLDGNPAHSGDSMVRGTLGS
jgi:anti-sigma-K factor RskA